MSVSMQPEFLLKIVEVLPGNIYCKDAAGRYVYCNDNVVRILGLKSRCEVIGKTDEDLLNKKGSQEVKGNDNVVIEQCKELEFEETGFDKNGREAVYLTKKMPLLDGCNRVIGVLGISMDITDRKKAEMAKSEFIQNISHDLRTPLTGLITVSESYVNSLSDDNDVLKEVFLLIQDSSRQLHQFLEKIIESVKLDNYSELPEALTSFSIEEIIRNVVDLFKPAIVGKSLSCSIYPIKQMIEKKLIGCPDLISRILMNLMGNAIKFTSNGGISIAYDVVLSTKDQQTMHHLVLKISDTGKGIPKSKHEVIFERLTRLSSSYKGLYEGHGLGLYITNRLVQIMNGHIKVESDGIEGEGSTFTCYIPIQLSNEALVPSNIVTPIKIKKIGKIKKYRILLADDSNIARCGAKMTLENNMPNCKIIEVETFQDIIQCIESEHYDLIITDLRFSDGDGKTAALQIRNLTTSKNQTTPIVALTGDTSSATEKGCMVSGINSVLHKPLTTDCLNRFINDFIDS